MNSESPTQKVKSCNSCKRTLPLNYFGLRKYSADGLNPCCKECRNFRRRIAYQEPNDLTDSVYPLNEHNRHFMWNLLDSVKKENLIGLDLQTLQPASVLLQRKGLKELHFTIKILNGDKN